MYFSPRRAARLSSHLVSRLTAPFGSYRSILVLSNVRVINKSRSSLAIATRYISRLARAAALLAASPSACPRVPALRESRASQPASRKIGRLAITASIIFPVTG